MADAAVTTRGRAFRLQWKDENPKLKAWTMTLIVAPKRGVPITPELPVLGYVVAVSPEEIAATAATLNDRLIVGFANAAKQTMEAMMQQHGLTEGEFMEVVATGVAALRMVGGIGEPMRLEGMMEWGSAQPQLRVVGQQLSDDDHRRISEALGSRIVKPLRLHTEGEGRPR